MDTDLWFVRYIVVDTRNWLPGKKVIVSPSWIDLINWADREIMVNLTQKKIESSPEYDGPMVLNRDYEQQLYDHYERVIYWQEAESIQ